MNQLRNKHQESFEKLGERGVRENLSQGFYGTKKEAAAKQFLEELERTRFEAFQSEQLDATRSAASAAWESAEKAKTANAIAKIALAAAIVAIAISIAGWFFNYGWFFN